MPDRFLELLAPHRADLERYCRAVVRSSGAVEDVLQQALANALRDFDRLHDAAGFRAFVFRYLVHESKNQNRRTMTAARREAPLLHEPVGAVHYLHAEVSHEELLAAPHAALEHCQDEVREAFLQLQAPQRDAFLLFGLGGFRAREVAEILEVPLGSALSLVFRARVQLRERLAEVAKDRGFLPREVQS